MVTSLGHSWILAPVIRLIYQKKRGEVPKILSYAAAHFTGVLLPSLHPGNQFALQILLHL